MNKRLSIILTLLAAALVSVFLYYFVEHYDEEIDKGWSTKALRNPYLALELLSDKRGIPVFSTDDYHVLGDLEEYDTVYITDSSLILSDQRLNALLKWVEQGGNLIVSATYDSEEGDDRLLSFFDFEQNAPSYNYASSNDTKEPLSDERSQGSEFDHQHVESDIEERTKSKKEKAQELIAQREARYGADTLADLSFEGIEGELSVLFDSSITLHHPGFSDENWHSEQYQLNSWSSSESGVTFAQLSYGRGLVSIMAGNTIWKSRYIDLYDHAYFWLIMSGQYKTGILYGSNMPSLFSIIKRYLPEVLYSSLLLLGVWLWWRMKRFGPTREIDIQTRRSYSEHIKGTAGFLWRRHRQDKLLEPLRNNIMSLAEARITGFGSAEDGEKYLMLSKQSHLSVSQVQKAFENQTRLNQDVFVNTVQVLQRIRESL